MFDSVTTGNGLVPTAVDWRRKVLVVLGTRPEAIKLAPVIHALRKSFFQTVVVSSSQHKQILAPFLTSLEIDVDFDLGVMKRDQSPADVCARVMARLDRILAQEKPDLVLVQGDTTTTLAGALAAFYRKIPVGHVEAGLRSGDLMSPYPEEMNRRLVSQMATMHFAATDENRKNLLAEGVADKQIYVTGNPVVDSLQKMLLHLRVGPEVASLLRRTDGLKRILLTTHRRESFATAMPENLRVLADIVEKRKDVCLIFPVHPNPNVRTVAKEILGNKDRIHLIDPLDYSDFLAIMRAAWVIVSDSGGVQEEAPSLGKPLLILRENTERPEAVASGVAKLVGGLSETLRDLLDEERLETWARGVKAVANPFGDGHAAERIVQIIERKLAAKGVRAAAAAATGTILQLPSR